MSVFRLILFTVFILINKRHIIIVCGLPRNRVVGLMLSKSSYKNLVEKFHRIGVIGDAIGLLHWDQATMMPEGSSSQRAEQLATLSVLRHETLINNISSG